MVRWFECYSAGSSSSGGMMEVMMRLFLLTVVTVMMTPWCSRFFRTFSFLSFQFSLRDAMIFSTCYAILMTIYYGF
jgi:hypothetical protein